MKVLSTRSCFTSRSRCVAYVWSDQSRRRSAVNARGSIAIALACLFGSACGGSSSGTPDAGPPDAEAFHLCGNFIVEPPEDCDDGNTDPDDGCAADCTLECGDGQVTGAELCDPAIAAGDPGACP